MVDLILKISRPCVIDIRSVLCKLEYCNYCVHKKCRMDRRLYESRHLIPMFIGTPCTLKLKMN